MVNDPLNDRDLRRRFSEDKSLSADEFANRHRHTVSDYYAGRGVHMSLDVTRREALKLWTHGQKERDCNQEPPP
jgi:hypothetical protein